MVMRDNYVRAAKYIGILDGDTFIAEIQLVPSRVMPTPVLRAHVRVNGWNAAELRDAEGPRMRDIFADLLSNAKQIHLELRYMSFERIVCSVFLDGVLFAGILEQRLQALRRSLASSG